jgi:hypothetical protein
MRQRIQPAGETPARGRRVRALREDPDWVAERFQIMSATWPDGLDLESTSTVSTSTESTSTESASTGAPAPGAPFGSV